MSAHLDVTTTYDYGKVETHRYLWDGYDPVEAFTIYLARKRGATGFVSSDRATLTVTMRGYAAIAGDRDVITDRVDWTDVVVFSDAMSTATPDQGSHERAAEAAAEPTSRQSEVSPTGQAGRQNAGAS